MNWTDPSDESSPACILVFNASDPWRRWRADGRHRHHCLRGRPRHRCGDRAPTRETQRRSSITSAWTTRPWQSRPACAGGPAGASHQVGFVGSPENISTIAEIATDYDDVPVIAYMPNLPGGRELIDEYLDAFRELLLPRLRCWLETTARCGAGCCPTGAATAAPPPATSPARHPRWACPTPWSPAFPARAVC